MVNCAAMNIEAHISFWIRVLSAYMPRSGIAGSYGNEEPPYCFHSGYTNLHSHQQCRSVPFLEMGGLKPCEDKPLAVHWGSSLVGGLVASVIG